MNIIKSGRWGLVLDSESVASKRFRTNHFGPVALKGGGEHAGHFVLERYTVDDDGNICLTPSFSMSELHGALDVIRAELQGLLEEARRRFPDALPAVDRVRSLNDWGTMTPRRD